MERHVFRLSGELALVGLAIFLVLSGGKSAQAPEERHLGAAEFAPPTLNLSVAGDIQQAVHFNFDEARRNPHRTPAFVAPLHALIVSPQDWVRIYTNSPHGLPHTARARIYLSALPERCLGNVMIGCVEVDVESRNYVIPLHPEVAARFGFVAPSAPGSYWIALRADWGFGTRTQVFLIDVRA